MSVPYEMIVKITHPNDFYSAEQIEAILNENQHLDKFKVEEIEDERIAACVNFCEGINTKDLVTFVDDAVYSRKEHDLIIGDITVTQTLINADAKSDLRLYVNSLYSQTAEHANRVASGAGYREPFRDAE